MWLELPNWEGDMEMWWAAHNASFGGRDQKEMWVPPASLNTTRRIWTPCAEFSSLSADYQPKKNILAGVLRVTHLQLKSLCVAEQVFCLLLFPCHFTHCAPQGLLLSWRQSPDKAEGLQPGERRPSWFLWDSLPPLLLSRRSGFRRIQHNTQKDLHIWEDFFK